MIDLHVHSEMSDGTDNFISILEKAEDRNLKYLSITDHDTCDIYRKFNSVNISEFYNGKIIPGIEIKTAALGVPIELLGYGVDPEKMNKLMSTFYNKDKDYDYIKMERLYERCLDVGLELDDDVLENYDNSYDYATTYLHEKITEKPENKKYILDEESWKDDTTFFRKHMSNPDSKFYIKNSDLMPSCQRVIDAIKQAGGLVFIPHIFIYGKKSKEILNYLVSNYAIDGVECFYSHFSKEHSEYLVDYCNKNNLYISGGSDYHGDNKPYINLGVGKGNLNVPSYIVDNWIDKVNFFYNDDNENIKIFNSNINQAKLVNI